MSDFLGRVGSLPFLDQIEKETREIKSAAIEGRVPDFSPDNLDPLGLALVKEETKLREELKNSKISRVLHTFEVDLTSPTMVGDIVDQLLYHKAKLDAGTDNTPTSLTAWVKDPTIADINVVEDTNVENTVPLFEIPDASEEDQKAVDDAAII